MAKVKANAKKATKENFEQWRDTAVEFGNNKRDFVSFLNETLDIEGYAEEWHMIERNPLLYYEILKAGRIAIKETLSLVPGITPKTAVAHLQKMFLTANNGFFAKVFVNYAAHLCEAIQHYRVDVP